MALTSEDKRVIYEFGPFRLDPAERLLLRDSKAVAIPPKAFDVLVVLARNGGRLSGKRELMREVWAGTAVEEANLQVQVSAVRKALGEVAGGRKYIETVPGSGYRLAADVRVIGPTEPEGGAAAGEVQPPGNGDEPPAAAASTPVAAPEPGPSAPPPRPGRFRIRPAVAVTGLSALALLAVSLVLYQLFARRYSAREAPFQRMKVTRLTTSGDAAFPALSPDVKFVAYVTGNAGRDSSMWLVQVGTTGAVQIIPPEAAILNGTTFSPDGQYLYFVKMPYKADGNPVLFQMPVLGGSARRPVAELPGLVGVFSLSPDGRRVAYVRRGADNGVTALMVLNLDGTGTRQVATRHAPAAFNSGKNGWSPDGRSVACIVTDGDPDRPGVVDVNIEGGAETPLTSGRWAEIRDAVWFSEPRGLLLTAKEAAHGLVQIWFVPYPEGEARRVTNDTNSYIRLSASADKRSFVTTEVDATSNVWVAPAEDVGRARQVTSGKFDGLAGLRWAGGDKIVFASARGGHPDIWVMDSDGTGQRQMTDDPYADGQPCMTPDGSIFFTSDRSGAKHIWRVDAEGLELRQLTDGKAEENPQCSPDGNWVFYNSSDLDVTTLWRVPAAGGRPEQITTAEALFPVPSPDGRYIAYSYVSRDEHVPGPSIAIIPAEGGAPVAAFTYHHPVLFNSVRWTADGRALTFLDNFGGTGRLWRQPVGGGAEHVLAEFKGDGPYLYDWSPDGRQFALARGPLVRDVILVSDFR